ncbi:MAG: hypothetical protein ACK4PG_07770 [Acetobacteraceae bacterium]
MDGSESQAISDPDPRLAPHLEPGERVLWQGWPEFAGLMSYSTIGTLAFMAFIFVGGPLIITLTAEEDIPLFIPFLSLPIFVAVIALVVWMKKKEARETVYALTDRRALHVQGGSLRRAEGPQRIERVQVARRGSSHGDVFWRTERRTTGSGKNRSTKTVRIGFLGVPQPDAVAEHVTAWKAERLARSAELAARFADAAEDGRIEEMVQAREAKRVSAPEAGVTFFAPADWTRVDGGMVAEISLRGGLMQMVQAITSGANTVRMMSPGGGAFQVTAGNGPPPQTFEQASQPRGGFQLLSADPQVRIGPWTGYAVARKLTGVNLFGFTMFASDVLEREIWLDLGGRHLMVKMAAPTDAHDLQRALDAMAQTLRPG